MAEFTHPSPGNNHEDNDHQDPRPFDELLSRPEIVYHGIGGDMMALQGIATHGLASVSRQVELTGNYTGNTPRSAAWNGNDTLSVAKAPAPGLPNEAFVEYIQHSPVVFAINSQVCPIEVPSARGVYDEAFITGAPREAIEGVVLDAKSADKPIADLPVLGKMATADKARSFMNFLITEYDAGLQSSLPELESLIAGIHYTTPPMVANNETMITFADEQSVQQINELLQRNLAAALTAEFGRPDLTVLEAVRLYFPDKPLYLKDHQNDTALYTEKDYFATLPIDATIGYKKWDGERDNDGTISVASTPLRQRLYQERRKNLKPTDGPPQG